MKCFYPHGRCLGGIGNSFGLYNALMHMTMMMTDNTRLLFPPTASCHGLNRLFSARKDAETSMMAGLKHLTMVCDASKYVTFGDICGASSTMPSWGVFPETPQLEIRAGRYSAWCNSVAFTTQGEGSGAHGNRCLPEHLVERGGTAAPWTGSRDGRCDSIMKVDLSKILWHFNTTLTRIEFQRLYYQSFAHRYNSPKLMGLLPKPNTRKVVVAVHIRLGGGSRFATIAKSANTSLRDSANPALREKCKSRHLLCGGAERAFTPKRSFFLKICRRLIQSWHWRPLRRS